MGGLWLSFNPSQHSYVWFYVEDGQD
eukprot:COSAG02_NODE_40640_length_403_cov_0.733553_1_plen_25_part_10